uniref:Uncharacterized protein n=1 Tax=Rhizophora mucronata TaxID=61149 RepID=A0A2P2QWZ9_RHIMU
MSKKLTPSIQRNTSSFPEWLYSWEKIIQIMKTNIMN